MILFVGAPIVVCGAGVGIYFSMSHKKTESKTPVKSNLATSETKSIYGMVDIFPKLNSYEFYSDLRIENGEAIMNDDFVAAVITKVIKDVKVTDGDIKWSYDIDQARKNLSLTFNWDKGGGNSFWKTYNFSLSV